LVLIIISGLEIRDYETAISVIPKPDFCEKTYGRIITFLFKLQWSVYAFHQVVQDVENNYTSAGSQFGAFVKKASTSDFH